MNHAGIEIEGGDEVLKCEHVYKTKGKFYNRKPWFWGGQLFTVFRFRICTLCHRLDRKVILKKRVTDQADTYEKQLQFSGIKPDSQIN